MAKFALLCMLLHLSLALTSAKPKIRKEDIEDDDWKVRAKSKDEVWLQTKKIQEVIDKGGKGLDALFKKWWSKYKKVYGKSFAKDLDEEVAMNAFWNQLERIVSQNSDSSSTYWSAANEFSDVDFSALKSKMLLKLNPKVAKAKKGKHLAKLTVTHLPPPKYLDWRSAGVVTPVRDQGQSCASCWAFAASALLESAYLMSRGYTISDKEKSLMQLSPQMLVDCENANYGWWSNGCNGGYTDAALDFAYTLNHTIESRYQYKGMENTCDFDAAFKDSGTKNIKAGGNESVVYPAQNSTFDLMAAVDRSPVGIYFNVQPSFLQYSAGIYTADSVECSPDVNHAMVVVGYYWTGTEAGSFWILKNSWGDDWGEDGYARVAFSDPSLPSGPCGMYQYPIAPPLQFKKNLSVD